MCAVTLAVPFSRKVTSPTSPNGEWVDTPERHRLVTFGDTARDLYRLARPGNALAVECVIRANRWTDAEGRDHHDAALVIERVCWLGGAAAP